MNNKMSNSSQAENEKKDTDSNKTSCPYCITQIDCHATCCPHCQKDLSDWVNLDNIDPTNTTALKSVLTILIRRSILKDAIKAICSSALVITVITIGISMYQKAEVKETLRKELKGELKEELTGVLKGELKNELLIEIEAELKNEVQLHVNESQRLKHQLKK